MEFRELALDIDYTGRGEDILRGFVLSCSPSPSSTTESQASLQRNLSSPIADGLEGAWN